MTALERFEQAIIRRRDVKLAEFYNEVKHQLENPWSMENMTAKQEYLHWKHRADIEMSTFDFIQETKKAIQRVKRNK